MSVWPVVPLCDAQKLDVDKADLLNDGLYRKCNTYHAGGGYDKFPQIFLSRAGWVPKNVQNQFVVQLRGCTMKCPYCYVTEQGVWGRPENVTTKELVEDFRKSGCGVFHLMGGAPAMYMEHWPELLEELDGAVFHSDFILNEKVYEPSVIQRIAKYKNQLHAVSIKATSAEDYSKKTGVAISNIGFRVMLNNLKMLANNGLQFYVTFTGMTDEEVAAFKELAPVPKEVFADSFKIDLVDYKAIHYGSSDK